MADGWMMVPVMLLIITGNACHIFPGKAGASDDAVTSLRLLPLGADQPFARVKGRKRRDGAVGGGYKSSVSALTGCEAIHDSQVELAGSPCDTHTAQEKHVTK